MNRRDFGVFLNIQCALLKSAGQCSILRGPGAEHCSKSSPRDLVIRRRTADKKPSPVLINGYRHWNWTAAAFVLSKIDFSCMTLESACEAHLTKSKRTILERIAWIRYVPFSREPWKALRRNRCRIAKNPFSPWKKFGRNFRFHIGSDWAPFGTHSRSLSSHLRHRRSRAEDAEQNCSEV